MEAYQKAADCPVAMVTVGPDALPFAYPYISGFIEAAAKTSRGIYTARDIVDLAVSNKVQLWAFQDKATGEYVGLVMTHIMPLGARPVCEILLVAGREVRRWKAWLPVLESWAKANGAVAMRCLKYERREKTHAFCGFKRLAAIYEKDLV